MSAAGYVGRFAPSPTGPLHIGSLVAAMASYLDARAHGGRWLLRIEDVDTPREIPGAADDIVRTLHVLGLAPDGEVVRQSARHARYQAAFDVLAAQGLVYPCACSRKEIADALAAAGRPLQRHGELVYPGTCRGGLAAGRSPRAWRVRVDDVQVQWEDRGGGSFDERLADEVGDFVLRRADGVWAYQLAVVVDDGAQGVTDVVRGEDLISSTARQIFLQQRLGLPRPRYLHIPVVVGDDGEKLSKQNGARALDLAQPLQALRCALGHLGLAIGPVPHVDGFWRAATVAWRERLASDGGLAGMFAPRDPLAGAGSPGPASRR